MDPIMPGSGIVQCRMVGEPAMKLLVLDEEFPFPLTNGKRTRSFNLYRRLADAFDIRYVAYGHRDSPAAEAMRTIGVEPVAVTPAVPRKQGPLFYFRLAANLVSPLPYIVTSHRSRRFATAVKNAVQAFRPDVIVAEWTPYACYIRNSSVRTFLSTHNVEADIWRRYHDTERNPARRWYVGRQWSKVDRFEREALRWVSGASAVSIGDRARLARHAPGTPITVVPNGVDLDHFRPLPHPTRRNQIVFTGSMDWRPNQDAVRHFVDEILPRLRAARPDIECTFVGRDPPSEIRALAERPGVWVTGTVDDVRRFVQPAAVYIVPLRIGGGSRLKVLEAMAMGRPIVSTTVGAEGIDVVDRRDLLLADDPAAFADSVLGLLDDAERCEALARAGRHLVETRYGWDAIARVFAAAIRATAAPAPPFRIVRPSADTEAFVPAVGRGFER